uniref:Ubiquitin thioesterase OTU n=1 Tax=Hanusia phi TaxID=3032 RepID=A0A7S0DZ62_9CRYP|mmetsp:Transcript_13275/g.30541  ORF Transcript_13275/g.30541 Transcript_13275/m.30541 type:complete len:328 (+) Transcript_13275:89-1072(+)
MGGQQSSQSKSRTPGLAGTCVESRKKKETAKSKVGGLTSVTSLHASSSVQANSVQHRAFDGKRNVLAPSVSKSKIRRPPSPFTDDESSESDEGEGFLPHLHNASRRLPTKNSRSFAQHPPPRLSSKSLQPRAASIGGANSFPKGTCDKCDGAHPTDSCPIYKKKREDHPDAWRNFGRKTPLEMGKGGGNFKLRSARVISQPGDGNCLFHSMAHSLPGARASSLRREIAEFIKENPDLEIADTPLRDWIKWDSGCSVAQYASRMAVTGWGGGIEMAACSYLKKVNVHVYEKGMLGSYKRISCFDVPSARQTIHVLYRGGVHYDTLIPG